MSAPSFTIAEFLRSDTALRRGIDNTPNATVLANITNILIPGMQRVRDLLAAPVLVSSGYRSLALNAAIGGSGRSQHVQGLACDFRAPGFGTPLEISRKLAENQASLRFDQLIFEGTWVHISFVSGKPRGQVLTAKFGGGGVRYLDGIVA